MGEIKVVEADVLGASLAIQGLSIRYGPGAPVVHEVDLEVPSGTVVALLGANGAGKTTLLRAVSGSLAVHRGSVLEGVVRVDGVDITRRRAADAVRGGIAQVMEGRRIFGSLNVEENLRTGAYCRRDKAGVHADLDRMYSLFPVLKTRRRDLAGYLSGGEQQMLAIGRALMARPRLLLLDEPSLGLAPKVISQVGEVVRGLRSEGLSILLVEQNAQMALSNADEGYVLETGRVARRDSATVLLNDPSIAQHYLGGAIPRRPAMLRSEASVGTDTRVLEVRDLALRFGGVKAIDDLSLEVNRGELVALIGPNGSGKTSTLNCISGLYQPNKGTICILGHEVQGRRPNQIAGLGVGRTLQHLALLRELSVSDNLLLGAHGECKHGSVAGTLRTPGWHRKEKALRADLAVTLERFELGRYASTTVGLLPYGVQKIVDLARAVMAKPTVLILDEPAAGLDGGETDAMGKLIASLSRETNISVLLVEHDMGMVMQLADRVIVLDFGSQIAEGTPAEIRADPRVIAAYLGEQPHAVPLVGSPIQHRTT